MPFRTAGGAQGSPIEISLWLQSRNPTSTGFPAAPFFLSFLRYSFARKLTASQKENHMSWFYLVLAGLVEIGWPVGLKMAQQPGGRAAGIAIAAVFFVASAWLLWLAQREIPIGTAYAVWTGIGAVGVFFLGILAYGEPASAARYFGVGMIVAGVVTLKVA
jgi:quaternary ammonium compound-resistance protein SugE